MKTFGEIRESFFGSKGASGVWQNIVAIMPPHDTFIEAFAGSAVVSYKKPRAAQHICWDVDESVVETLCAEHHAAVESGNPTPFDKVECVDSLAALRVQPYNNMGRVLIYCDPPYVHSTRTSSKRYPHEMADIQHLDLLRTLDWLVTHHSNVQVILSGYPNDLYDDYEFTRPKRWNTVEFQAMTRGGPRTEKLWYSFDVNAVMDARAAGVNFTDRQRIKRKAERWKKNYEKLPAGERFAILAAIMSVHQGR